MAGGDERSDVRRNGNPLNDAPLNDARLNAARYRLDRDSVDGSTEPDAAGPASAEQHAHFVRVSIEQAERRGDFDGLPGSGKPLADLHDRHDPDWWIRRKIEREQITGLGPPALTLRTEDRELDARLDAAASERAVRETLEDFNRSVVEARRQLQGGPPVVTPTREVDAEVGRWRERRSARLREAAEARGREEAARRALTWRERRRARRAGEDRLDSRG